ncbi:MAG: hypothetical protein JRJ35_17315 [Deltaproteobacteria bacterium]|nr:hypothetical protein [Deltaproteobacteria bacterium]
MFRKALKTSFFPIALACIFFLCQAPGLAQVVTVTDITGIEVPEYYSGVGCGPLAAASLMGYWDQRGYEGLLGVSGWDQVRLTSHVSAELDILAEYLNTDSDGWTLSNNVPSGLEAYALNEGGYEFESANHYFSSLHPDELPSLVMSEIDAGRPLIFLVDTNSDGSSDHFVPVFGYEKDDVSEELLNYEFYKNWSEDEIPFSENFTQAISGEDWGVNVVTTLVPLSEPDPVPIPGTLVLLAGGLGGLMAVRKRWWTAH